MDSLLHTNFATIDVGFLLWHMIGDIDGVIPPKLPQPNS